MKHIYRFLLCCAATTMLAPAVAAPLSPQQALSRLNTSNTSVKKIQGRHASPAMTITADRMQTLYIFNRGENEGFVILPADDSSLPLLGYSDQGNITDDTNLPPAFRYWLKTLSQQVALNAKGNARPVPQRVVGSAIAPMVETRWNQDAPYYNDCPIVDGRHCYTGCVATALSQIMYYHQYPATGTGSHSYSWTNSATQKDTTLTYDYATANFEWDKMLLRYGGSSDSAESKAAVANLMYAAGVAVDMGYGIDESGASTTRLPHAMVSYFNYDKGTRIFLRDYYELDDWNTLVYNQLKTYGPVQYSGQSNEGGHSFVCDGYNSDGYFHINWGWGGMSDGYYLLTALDPGEQGIGGSASGYNFDQDIIGNVSTKNTSTEIAPVIYWGSDFGVNKTTATLGDDITVSGNAYSYSADTLSDIGFGVALKSETDGKVVIMHGPTGSSLAPEYGIGSYDVKLPTDLAAGTYKVYPVFRIGTGEWYAIPVQVGLNGYYTMTVDGTACTLIPQGEAAITVTDFTNTTPFYIGSESEIKATLTNNTDNEYLGTLNILFVSTGTDGTETIVAGGEDVAVDVPAGSTQDFAYVTSIAGNNGTTPAAGTYDLYLAEKTSDGYTPVAGPLSVTLNAEAKPKFEVVDFNLPASQNKEDIKASCTVKVTEGYYYGPIKLGLFENASDGVQTWLTSDYVSMSTENPEATVMFSGKYPSAEIGKNYYGVLFANNTQLNYPQGFTVDVASGVETITTDAQEGGAYYTLTGAGLAKRPTRPGLYIHNGSKIIIR